jgi:hypothetical protein
MMEKEGWDLGDQVENEEELLNFDLDDISTEDLDKMNFDSDDEIIELTDLVEKGPDDEETRAMDGNWRGESEASETGPEIDFSTKEIAKAMDEAPGESPKHSEDEIDMSDISLELDVKDEGEGEPEQKGFEGEITAAELDSILEENSLEPQIEMVEKPAQETVQEEDISAPNLEGLFEESAQEEGAVDLGEEAEMEEPEISVEEQKAAEDFLESAREDDAAVALEPEEESEPEGETQAFIEMDDLPRSPEPEPEPDVADTAFETTTTSESLGISEEKIEAVMTRVVEDVAERVIRQTVAEVTEKVLTEVIDALKKSLESTPE